MSTTASELFKLHKETGMGIMDCKEALAEANGDVAAAKEILRRKAEPPQPKYLLVTGGSDSSDEINKFWMDITDLIDSGWKCQGGVSVTVNNSKGTLVFHQAMVRAY